LARQLLGLLFLELSLSSFSVSFFDIIHCSVHSDKTNKGRNNSNRNSESIARTFFLWFGIRGNKIGEGTSLLTSLMDWIGCVIVAVEWSAFLSLSDEFVVESLDTQVWAYIKSVNMHQRSNLGIVWNNDSNITALKNLVWLLNDFGCIFAEDISSTHWVSKVENDVINFRGLDLNCLSDRLNSPHFIK